MSNGKEVVQTIESQHSQHNLLILTLILICSAALWTAFCIMVSKMRWEYFDIGIDTAAWAQTLHNGITGSSWNYTCYPDTDFLIPRPFYSIHFYNFIWLLSPVFSLFQHPLTLYVIQHLAHAIGGIIIGILAWQLSSGDKLFAFLMTWTFFLYPPHARAQTAFDVNPKHYALLLIPAATLAYYKNKCKTTLLLLTLLTAAEESLGLAAGFLSWTFAIKGTKNRRTYIIAGALFCSYTFLVIKFGLPYFLKPEFQIHFASRYVHLFSGAKAWFSALFRMENLYYAMALLVPLLFLNIIKPKAWWIAAIPFLAQNLLSFESDVKLIGHHYTSPLAVVLFLGALEAAAVNMGNKRNIIASLVCFACFIASISIYPSIPYLWEGVDARTAELGTALHAIEAQIPPNDSVSAPPPLCAHLWARPQLWFFPKGLKVASWIAFPKYIPGYPSFSETDLNLWFLTLSKDPSLVKVMENSDVILFHRTKHLGDIN